MAKSAWGQQAGFPSTRRIWFLPSPKFDLWPFFAIFGVHHRPSGNTYTVAELQAFGGDFATNRGVEPTFRSEITGAMPTVVYYAKEDYSVIMDASSPFVYLYRFVAGDHIETRKMVLVK